MQMSIRFVRSVLHFRFLWWWRGGSGFCPTDEWNEMGMRNWKWRVILEENPSVLGDTSTFFSPLSWFRLQTSLIFGWRVLAPLFGVEACVLPPVESQWVRFWSANAVRNTLNFRLQVWPRHLECRASDPEGLRYRTVCVIKPLFSSGLNQGSRPRPFNRFLWLKAIFFRRWRRPQVGASFFLKLFDRGGLSTY